MKKIMIVGLFMCALSAHSMNRATDMAKKMLVSKTPIVVSSVKGKRETTFSQLIKDAKQKKEPIVLTFTAGPFKPTDKLPRSWMQTEKAIGCSNQLDAFNKSMAELNAKIYAINRQSSDYQCGENGVLALKQLHDLEMISDENGQLTREFDLPTIEVDGNYYLARFSLAFNRNGEAKEFPLDSPVTKEGANAHIYAINEFIE